MWRRDDDTQSYGTPQLERDTLAHAVPDFLLKPTPNLTTPTRLTLGNSGAFAALAAAPETSYNCM